MNINITKSQAKYLYHLLIYTKVCRFTDNTDYPKINRIMEKLK